MGFHLERLDKKGEPPIPLAGTTTLGHYPDNTVALSADDSCVSDYHAVGLWQFMPKTARDYGLDVSTHRDERTNPEKATYAAAAYFKDLIAIFGSKSSVMLCMAAYNAGETRIINALKRVNDPVNNRDFWYLYKMKWLAEETNEYIPQILALIIISEHQTEYGFD